MNVKHDASDAECLIFTFKEGLLSAVAHDLRLRVTRFQITVTPDRGIEAWFDADSIKVVCARASGHDQPDALSPKDQAEIERNIAREVLRSSKHPRITFRSTETAETGDGYKITGELEIRGQKRSIVFLAHRRGGTLQAEALLHQPDFGIKPYSAMLGALKIKPDVQIAVTIPF